ncbi:MAG TPA: phosphatidate cytidylyltransferase [Flavobacteriales bacterium]|nr:phosphatidate cytidylyltransferase [Flavobacteriales bacterium]
MNELLKRSFFGLIYALTVILALQNYITTAALLAVFLIIAITEFSRLVSINYKLVLLPSLFIFLTTFLFYYTDNFNPNVVKIAVGFSLLTLFTPFIYFIFDRISKENLALIYLSVFYLAIPFSIALTMSGNLLLAIFLIIWASDSFAYLVGKNFGKHKLAPQISPKKTIEGVIGGLTGGLMTAYLIFIFFDDSLMINLGTFLILAIIIVIFGTLGDLLESRFKRLANVKDSGNIIPGHGGILDRLDSFIFAVPFVYIFLQII